MRTIGILIRLSTVLCLSSQVLAQSPVPLGDMVEEPLLPSGISDRNVEMFGDLVSLWTADDGSDVVHYVGDFELHLGQRRVKAREAVVWMTRREYDGRPYTFFEIFCWRDARVVEPGGTAAMGPVLFATLSSFGKAEVWADRKTRTSTADTTVYREALRVRNELRGKAVPEPEAPSPVTVLDMGAVPGREEPRVRPPITYRGQNLAVQQRPEGTVITVVGDVYVSRADPTGLETVELRADAAALFLARDETEAGEERDRDAVGEDAPRIGDELGPRAQPSQLEEKEGAGIVPGLKDVSGAPWAQTVSDVGPVQAAYLEGDVILTYGERVVRASRLYYDFETDRALIMDPVAFTPVPDVGVPIYVRADHIRQLSSREWTAYHARVTTSEFYTPHYHIGAETVDVVDRTPRAMGGALVGERAGTITMRNTTFNVGNVPIAFWPYAQSEVREDISPLRRSSLGYSGDFGAEIETRWDLFSLVGVAQPEGVNGTVRIDAYTKRGPGGGVDLDYKQDTHYGFFTGYYIYDKGEDNLGGLRGDVEPDHENRGRATWRHRHFLPDDWQLTLEVSLVSSGNFLEEYFEREFDFSKKQETAVYLKKQRDNWAFTALANFHLNDWFTETEHLPEAGFHLTGQSLGGVATLYSDNRAGLVRYRFAEQPFWQNLLIGRENSSGTTARFDTRQEVDAPIDLGPVRVVPFTSLRGTLWDDSPQRGGLQRMFTTAGVRASMYFWRVYENARSEFFDIDGIRHVIKPDVTVWGSCSNVDARDTYPFTQNVESLDDFDGVAMGIRQRWQTHRGDEGRRRTTDLFLLDLELGAFNDAHKSDKINGFNGLSGFYNPNGAPFTNGFTSYRRPENSVAVNYLNASAVWRMSDSMAVAAESNFDINDGEVDVLTVSLAAERRPRLSYLVGYRFINETASNLLGIGANYRISEKYMVAVREAFDLQRGETEEFTIAVIRKLPRWYVGFTFQVDDVDDDIGLAVSAWPEGFPGLALGSRRFTGLATTTGIRPE